MEPLLISDEPNWTEKAINQLESSSAFERIETDNGLIALPIVMEKNLLIVGYANYDAPNIQRAEQKVNYPRLVFSTSYPRYEFTQRKTIPVHNPLTAGRYGMLFGQPQSFTPYYVRVHSKQDQLEEYYRLISEVLAHHWLTGRSALPSSPELAGQTARAIAPFFKGAPENLRDFYIQEGKPFLDWLLQHL